jgi:hypothetical protein
MSDVTKMGDCRIGEREMATLFRIAMNERRQGAEHKLQLDTPYTPWPPPASLKHLRKS